MCDTVLVTPETSSRRATLFGKNSDRQRNEAQAVELLPSAGYPSSSRVACTYITIPQAVHTHGVLLCRPFWMWGAEMGANEHGVVIGNEGLHTRGPPPEQAALTGMDLVRLGLERAASAEAAVSLLTELLERHGQGGNCGHLTPSYYHNGFVIADAESAFVLETVGREWLVARIRGAHAFSNRYGIERADFISAGLTELIREMEWGDEGQLNYAATLANPDREHVGNAGARRAHATSLLRTPLGQIGPGDVMALLRDHGSGTGPHPGWRDECAVTRTLCMHAGADDRNAQTVGSMVSELNADGAVHWVTGTAAPCISIFKPVLMDAALPSQGPRLTDRFDPVARWWRHEQLHRTVLLGDFARFLEEIREERDSLEEDFRRRVKQAIDGGEHADRSQVVAECWKQACEMEDLWRERLCSGLPMPQAAYVAGWTKMNAAAGLEVLCRE